MSAIKIKIENHVATLTLNRPQVRNAFDAEMIDELAKAFWDLSLKPDLRVLVLEGEGESFCAGADLNWMKSMAKFSRIENIEDSEKLYNMFKALADLPCPVLSVVQGHVMGGALGLVAASDICLSVDKTQFCFSEVRLGLAPAVISSFVASKVTPSDLHRYFLTAEVFGPKEARRMGLIQDFGSAKEIKDLKNQIVKKLSQNGPLAVRASKALLKQLPTLEDPKKVTTELIANLRVSPEGQEGLTAFLEKRKPNWLEPQS